jgi:hypothetical protein
MGLDMYMSVRKYISRIDFSKGYDEEKGWSRNDEFDRMLEVTGMTEFPEKDETSGMSIEVPVMYWRKANAIHKWFVDNWAEGVDDCRPISINVDDLEELKNLCEQVAQDHSKADELLPTEGGFFFGSTEYDDWYFRDIEYTAERLPQVIDMMRKSDIDYATYQASW